MSSLNPELRADHGSADVSMDAKLEEASTKLPKFTELSDSPKQVEAAEQNAGLHETTPNLSQHAQVSESQRMETAVDRFAYIKKKMEDNQMKLANDTKKNHMLAVERKDLGKTDGGKTTDNLLTMRMKQATDMQNGVGISATQNGKHASVVLTRHGIAVKKSVRPITLPNAEKIPRYTTWVFSDRNEIMREDQSVIGKRRLYYDLEEGETLICSDSEEEATDNDNDNNKKESVEPADKTIWSTAEHNESSNSERDKDLEAAQSSFNKSFCRRCLIFGCKLHGSSQQLIYPGTTCARPHATSSDISENDLECRRQYNPCGCQSLCGDDCSCLKNGTVCEKFCGCPKTCKNRYRGCYCAKSKCRTRQCPCFASNRECDPDVCRRCWISCGYETLGSPSKEGNFECENMKIFLKQRKQKVLLGRSEVDGWGVFLRNDVAKDEYLGEYTGELISHREAEKRGKIYDREDSSYLFNLDDQFVVDGKRVSNKFKFVNHSHKPNCYLKVIKVMGDHRVGVFAKKNICAGEELLCDYCYDDDNAPSWAKEPEDNDSEEIDCTASSSERAKTHL